MVRIWFTFFAITAELTCGVVVAQATGSESDGSFSAEHISPDKTLILRCKLHSPQLEYQLIEATSGRLLATAESALIPDDVRTRHIQIPGVVEAVFAPQDSSMSVREDVGDASTAVRFIYFERQQDGSYATYYLKPPFDRWDKEPIAVDFPHFISLDQKKVTLYYDHSRRRKVMKLAAISKTKDPETAN